ncbi:MAG: endonuclease [Candidatus Magasanikbacteria bacterium CG_4_9_14_0_2_um_filter_41_10]|uniref:Endonuclease n=1 Tax=Candidatus Magasanikbacteria bacterium CG_4_10_14_0_2_um_filter_41_31 TaxID=1974639 RepID=A0A2M7V361_9BACT|nr:MAG: endonuclease [Candidatus Magasanikbacteria bacterium CG1_02_41_34]PIZ92912.1 MAG: endonuclease [Candidatus Magasanikbacteria bacterium CG_4_10_14_0_2_um_filter_41_31]PJC53729.1 MAG: endonuclease [Candidatus Magasanikbacteria bacterium CG_4_9_14_0_2_um_filter_41_10]
MYYVYILQSTVTNRYYVGHTQDIQNRLDRHNKKRVRSTKSGVPWELVYTEMFDTKAEAYKREMQIKSYKGGNAFRELL